MCGVKWTMGGLRSSTDIHWNGGRTGWHKFRRIIEEPNQFSRLARSFLEQGYFSYIPQIKTATSEYDRIIDLLVNTGGTQELLFCEWNNKQQEVIHRFVINTELRMTTRETWVLESSGTRPEIPAAIPDDDPD